MLFIDDQVDEIRMLLEEINISIETKLLKMTDETVEAESGGFLSSIPRMLGFRRSADGARINQLEEMQPLLAPLFDIENCFDSKNYVEAKRLLTKSKEIIDEIEALCLKIHQKKFFAFAVYESITFENLW